MQTTTSRQRTDPDERDDADLVDLARRGDEDAVRAIIQRNNRRLFRVARAVVRDDAEAEDVVQETYVRAMTSLDSFRGDSLLSTWLTRIALNEALGRMRRRRPTTGLAALDAADEGSGGRLIMFPMQPPASPEAELARNETRRLLEQAVDELPDPFRIVFILRDIEEMSTEETAAHLSLKLETVKTRLHRARRLIRASIEQRLSAAFSELFPFDGTRCARMADRVVDALNRRHAG